MDSNSRQLTETNGIKNCTKTEKIDDSYECTECDEGFILHQNKFKVECVVPQCQLMDEEGVKCKACRTPFYLKNGKCLIQNCAE